MRWLWLAKEDLVATVDLDDDNRIRNCPPPFHQFEGIKQHDFEQIMYTKYPDIHIEEKYFNDNPPNRVNKF